MFRMTMRAGREARNAGSFLRWQSCIGLPSRAKLALSLSIKGPSFCLPDRDGAGRSPEEHRKSAKRPDAPILRRLTAPPPLPEEGGYILRRSRHLPLERQRTQPFYTTCRRQARPFFYLTAAKRRYHNPRPVGPSNLRTFGAKAPSILRTLTPSACQKI
jgi:hypothetical protein